MLPIVGLYFSNFPAKRRIVEILLKNGISVKHGKFFAGSLEVPITAIAKAAKVNRKVIYYTIEYIEKNYVLKKIFGSLKPTTDFREAAPLWNFDVIELNIANNYLLNVLRKLPKIKMFQIIASENSEEMVIVSKTQITHKLLEKIKNIRGVKRVTLFIPKKRNIKICNKCKIKVCSMVQ